MTKNSDLFPPLPALPGQRLRPPGASSSASSHPYGGRGRSGKRTTTYRTVQVFPPNGTRTTPTRPRNRLDRPRNVVNIEDARAPDENPDSSRQRAWSAEQHDTAMAAYRARGLAAASRETGIAKSTLRGWAREAGLDPAELAGDASLRTVAAVEASQRRMEQARADIRERLLEEAAAALDRLGAPYVEFVGTGAQRVEYPLPPAGAAWHLMKTAATAIDKFRLESGEATVLTGDAASLEERVERAALGRDELDARRKSAA